MTAGIATIATIGFMTYQIFQSQAESSVDTLKININNTVDGVISSVTQENREGVEEIVTPLVELIEANLNKDSAAMDKSEFVKTADALEKRITDLSMLSYQADSSPFVPPINKVQFLCGEDFTLA
ncbi:MAG: hypothetical protein KZQ89_01735 [Candidatus Thiodiazotropha sp. (ex Lucinoma kastoroae)]|nr:hypothetical protein [Candidatus Thiodiazotropha sp. (ex Rostrolucina anterorostrata)]MCU7846724.1 hypothetical protein [Candidatus Thiodiazotropha sp. (ex Lucinoma kastoroae)]